MNIYLEVYGCTANKSDASIIKGLIDEDPSYQQVATLGMADVIIILTCTVISTTEQRMLSRISTLLNTGKKIIIAGCMASVQKDLLLRFFPKALLVSPSQVHHILQILDENMVHTSLEKHQVHKRFDSIIAPISIAEGCQYHCHYCITCKARGHLVSYPQASLSRDVKQAVKQGCKEIQLTAQDTASYGFDSDHNLGSLLDHLCIIPGDYRIRVGMMNPRSVLRIMQSIIDGYRHLQIYKFLHLPVQSGDDDLLYQMNRGYTIEEYRSIITSFKTAYPQLGLSTDIIVGFPGETDEQFQHSINFLQKIKPDTINITRFSARPMTPAKNMKNRIPTDIVKQRSRTITEIAMTLTEQKNKSYIGSELSVLITHQKKSGSVLGRAPNYKAVVIKKQLPLGEYQLVKITDATPYYLIGTLK